MTNEWRAQVVEDMSTFQRNVARLLLWRVLGSSGAEVLMADGLWRSVGPAEAVPGEAGILIPRGALAPLGQAVVAHVGDALPSAGEVRVLREWLAVERGRVNSVLTGGRP